MIFKLVLDINSIYSISSSYCHPYLSSRSLSRLLTFLLMCASFTGQLDAGKHFICIIVSITLIDIDPKREILVVHVHA